MEKEPKFILCFIIALFNLIISFLYKRTMLKFNKKVRDNEIEGIGKIERIIQDDGGYTWFYVSFEVEGKKYIGQTSSHLKTPKNIVKGDEVNIKYYFGKGKYALCRIMEKGFESFDNPNDDVGIIKFSKYISFISLIFFILGFILLIEYFFG